MTFLDHALALARRGFRVHPLRANGKKGREGWPVDATTDPTKIRQMWADKPRSNVGICTDGWLVLDIDTKRDGHISLIELQAENGPLPETFKVRTPSGGCHLYFKVPHKIASSMDELGAGIEVKANNRTGYGANVVAPGSAIDGRTYEIVDDREPAEAPAWLVRVCGEASLRKDTDRTPARDLDEPDDIEFCRAFLASAEPAVQYSIGGGNNYTYKLATRALEKCAVNPQTLLGVMLEPSGWNERCEPPWSPEELEVLVVENAGEYMNSPYAWQNAKTEFSLAPPVPANDDQPKPRSALFYERASAVEPDLSAAPLIDNWLDQGAMSVIYGESNVGKTFIMMDMAWAVATGRPWHGCDVEPGLVVYVAAEAGSSARRRVKVLRLAKGGESEPAFALVPCPVDLLHSDGDMKPLVELIRAIEKDFGQRVALVVIDTLSRALAGGNENDSADMGALVKNLDRIRVALRCHLAVVHHSGKDRAKGARGHSLLRAATDTEIEIADGRITGMKQRDMEVPAPVGFKLRSVPLGENSKGKIVTSAVVDTFIPVAAVEVPIPKAGSKGALALASLKALQAGTKGAPVAIETWQADLKINVLGKSWREEFKRLVIQIGPHLTFSEDQRSVGLCQILSDS